MREPHPTADINKYINDYDTIFENIEYPFVHYIKKRIIKKYGTTRTLPNSLQLDAVFIVDVSPHKALEVV
jgi:alkyl hydroperoxide reductase subunit AhpC